MEKEDKELFVEDVFTILSNDHYHGRIVKSDLVKELRGGWMQTYCIGKYTWPLSASFINSEMEDILREAGFAIDYVMTKNGKFVRSTYFTV